MIKTTGWMTLKEWIFPPRCIFCHRILPIERTERGICNDCLGGLPVITENSCAHCGKPLLTEQAICQRCETQRDIFHQGFGVFPYHKIRKVIFDFKFQEHKNDGIVLGKIMARYWKEYYGQLLEKTDILLPIPMFEKKKRQRGFNQAEILTETIAKELALEYACDVLMRVKNTVAQNRLKMEERKQNIKGAFSVEQAEKVEGKTVVLVDDIFTTGSTINECAKVLFRYGAKEVNFVALSIVAEDGVEGIFLDINDDCDGIKRLEKK